MGQTLSSYGKNLQQGRGWKKILAIVPVPLLVTIIIILAFINPTLVFEPPFLLPTLNVLLLSLIPFSVAYLAWKSYAKSGALPLLFVGCGMVAFGYGSLVAGFTINIPGGTNLTPTIHNTGALLAILLVAAALFALWKDAAYKSPKHGGLYLGLCYLAVLIFMSLFTLAALAGLVPPFFVQGTGPTVLRQFVLGAATVLFAVSTVIFLRAYFRSRADFTYWFSLALALITIGLCAVFIQKGVGTMVGWAGRTAQYLGCIYLLIGIISAVRLSGKKGILLEKEITKSFNFIEANYKTLVEMASDAIVSVDNEGTILTWNPAAAKIFGYSVSEATGANVIDFIFPRESALLLNSELQKLARAKGQTAESGHKLELTARRKTGGDFPAEVSVAMRKIMGEWLGTFIIRDISERKQAEEALRESEIRFRGLFNFMSSGVAVYEAVDNGGDFIIRDFNPAAEKIEKVSRKDIVGKRVSEAFTGVKTFGVFEVFQRVWQTGKPEYFPTNIYKDERDPGSWRESWVFKLPGGEIVAMYNDITERKQLEEAVIESEERYRTILEQIYDHYYEVDLAGNFTFLNESTCRKFGYSIEELIGKSYRLTVPEDDSAGLFAASKAVFKSGEPNKCYPHRILNKDGSIIFAESFIGLRRNKQGEIIGFRTVSQDITQRKQAEEKLAESARKLVARNEELRSALADKEVLLKEVHHRVKNNLMVISSLLNLQMRRTKDQEARESLRESNTRVMSMAMIHEQVLRSGQYAAIDTTSYINGLVSNIRNSLAPYKKDVI
ncbi:MAG: PAS domain S-box protein, partial [Chloroflexi bacterium]|nr:PAS domain S-box protein [Chloroflexota bacterium]